MGRLKGMGMTEQAKLRMANEMFSFLDDRIKLPKDNEDRKKLEACNSKDFDLSEYQTLLKQWVLPIVCHNVRCLI